MGDRPCGSKAPSSRGRLVDRLTTKACTTMSTPPLPPWLSEPKARVSLGRIETFLGRRDVEGQPMDTELTRSVHLAGGPRAPIGGLLVQNGTFAWPPSVSASCRSAVHALCVYLLPGVVDFLFILFRRFEGKPVCDDALLSIFDSRLVAGLLDTNFVTRPLPSFLYAVLTARPRPISFSLSLSPPSYRCTCTRPRRGGRRKGRKSPPTTMKKTGAKRKRAGAPQTTTAAAPPPTPPRRRPPRPSGHPKRRSP